MAKLKKIRLLNLLFFIGSTSIFVGCISVSPHQTGRTLGEKGAVLHGSYNFGMVNEGQVFRGDKGSTEIRDDDNTTLHLIEVGAQAALNENIDIGFRMNNSGHFTGTLKGQILGNKSSLFASSMGTEAGFNAFGIVSVMAGFHVAFSSFNSLHVTDYLAIGFSPRYIFVDVSGYGPFKSWSYSGSMLGYSAGLYAGRKHIFSLEFSQYALDMPYRAYHSPIISLGVNFRLQ